MQENDTTNSLYTSPGPVLIEVHAGTTLALGPARTADVPAVDLEAGNTVGAGATATPPCQTVADTSATEYIWFRVKFLEFD